MQLELGWEHYHNDGLGYSDLVDNIPTLRITTFNENKWFTYIFCRVVFWE